MNAPTDDLVTWLLEQVTEDEQRARYRLADSTNFGAFEWDPDQVLAECEAKRQLIKIVDWLDNYPAPIHSLTDRPSRLVLRYMALPYSDRPDYREEWRL